MMTDWKRRISNARPDEYRMSKNGKKIQKNSGPKKQVSEYFG